MYIYFCMFCFYEKVTVLFPLCCLKILDHFSVDHSSNTHHLLQKVFNMLTVSLYNFVNQKNESPLILAAFNTLNSFHGDFFAWVFCNVQLLLNFLLLKVIHKPLHLCSKTFWSKRKFVPWKRFIFSHLTKKWFPYLFWPVECFKVSDKMFF